nr:hypothetical protein Iba_chr05eCG10290 [Ipomoea batatas]
MTDEDHYLVCGGEEEDDMDHLSHSCIVALDIWRRTYRPRSFNLCMSFSTSVWIKENCTSCEWVDDGTVGLPDPNRAATTITTLANEATWLLFERARKVSTGLASVGDTIKRGGSWAIRSM